jgi:uncharacterized OB-fold protein
VSRNEATARFFDGTAAGQFLLLRCPQGHANRPQADLCGVCRSAHLEPFPASGAVRLVSWAVIPPRPGSETQEPAVPAIVEFAEGPWWWAPLLGADPASLQAGQELVLSFEQPEGSEAVPVFRPRR